MNPSKEENLIQLLKKQAAYYRAMLSVTQEEQTMLSSGQPFSEITLVLKKKQILMACIAELEEPLKPLKLWWKERAHPNSEVELELAQLNLLVMQILELDLSNQEKLKARMAAISPQSH
jgi:flagellar biosynthesis/type III secretory pathway chaperone